MNTFDDRPALVGKLNHMSFPSDDMSATSTFFERYLGFTIAMIEAEFTILKRPGFDVVIEAARAHAPTIQTIQARKPTRAFGRSVSTNPNVVVWPMSFHIGLELPDCDDVRALYERLSQDGFVAETEVFQHERGSRFFLRAPGGVMIEFNTRADAGPRYRGTFD